MADEASPASLSYAHDSSSHRSSIGRQSSQSSRSSLLRHSSTRISPASSISASRNVQTSMRHNYSADSSDDEVPEPKFSASVKALLEGDAMSIDTSPRQETSAKRLSIVDRERRSPTPAAPRPERHVRVTSPHEQSNGSPAPRVVRIASVRMASRPGSSDGQEHGHSEKDFITPAPKPRSVRITGSRSTSHSPWSTSPTGQKSGGSDALGRLRSEGLSGDDNAPRADEDHAPRIGTASVLRNRAGDEPGIQSSLRIKRVGRLTGSFLNGPARRGVLRRQSEENNEPSPVEEGSPENPKEPEEKHRAGSPEQPARKNYSPRLSWIDSDPRVLEKPAPARSQNHVEEPFRESSSPQSAGSHSRTPRTSSGGSLPSEDAKAQQPVYRVPPPPNLPSGQDQENDPPPTFKRTKPSAFSSLLDKQGKLSVVYDDDDKKGADQAPEGNSPRKPLSSRSNNTPHRAPPPPPKMSVLETATASGGAASTSHSRKKRSQVTINQKTFTRMDCIGRGGSSRVYRVMAENYKIFALKRVNLEDVDRLTLAGYKGEIELLKKLENVERVVRLFDWELNMEKHTLSVLMEIGESDLEKILTYRLNADDAKFDISFTRYYWKEMLECVQAVHDFNIVHSDLKPANFLLVQGRLKLIDFGIANAIQDNTVNVHREQQVGTPNYMSPEALIDANAALGLPASVGKMMKLGKPSDVWSLGCILYKMVYGQPPFARIAKYIERIMAIPNPKVAIEFPEFAIGGVTVPAGLMRTMKACLQRDQTLRPTVKELLREGDPFLYPDTRLEGTVPVSQEMIGRILTNVVNHCRTRGIPSEQEVAAWPAGFFSKIKAAVEEEGRR